MKKILLLAFLSVSAGVFGQSAVQVFRPGSVDAYTKAQTITIIGTQIKDSLNNLSINMTEATDSKIDEDTIVVIDNGQLEYLTRTNLFNLDWQRYVKYDTTTALTGTLTSAITTTITLSNLGYLYAWPIMFPKDVVIDKIYTETTSSVATSVYVIAVYADNGATYPGIKIFNSIEFSGAATSLKYELLTSPVTFHKNTLYWLVYESNVAAPVLRALAGNTVIGVLNFVPGLTGQVTCYSRLSTYNTSLPTSFPSNATYLTNQPIPLTWFQEQ